MRLKIFLLLAAVTAMMAFSAPAFAQTMNPAADVYGGDAGEVLDETVSTTPDDVVPPAGEVASEAPAAPQPVNVVSKTAPTVATGSLPFTGFEAGLVALLGIALLGTGFALRRTTRRTTA